MKSTTIDDKRAAATAGSHDRSQVTDSDIAMEDAATIAPASSNPPQAPSSNSPSNSVTAPPGPCDSCEKNMIENDLAWVRREKDIWKT